LPLLAIVTYAVALYGSRRALEAELATIRDAGGALRLAELAPWLPEGARNASDVYHTAFEFLPAVGAEDSDKIGGEFDLEFARAAVEARAVGLKLLQQASEIPDCAFPTDWSAGL
ncbi:MAG: hypothetical protein GTO28_12340, partial [Gammaproteobacteria bacterium]|nr:hypothetical protein [Gammaproteobacteria bacterium]